VGEIREWLIITLYSKDTKVLVFVKEEEEEEDEYYVASTTKKPLFGDWLEVCYLLEAKTTLC
jgi:hypothetical protein